MCRHPDSIRDGYVSRLRNVAIRPLRRFARDEDGSLIFFGLVLFVLMIMMGGLAVDLMRYEQRRTALQQTIDRSVLAAASLTQDLDPEAVVNDYFDKAGLLQYLADVRVTQGLNFRIVEAEAHADLDPFFTHMVGIDEFDVPAASAAEQRITNVEIMLVLDVSGSMNEASAGSTKIANLRIAAKNFVDKVKANDTENRISIGIVPYNAQVNLGPVLRAKYNATNLHGVANVDCLDLPQTVFDTVGISRTTPYPMFAFADTSQGTNTANSYTSWNDTSGNGGRMSTSAPYCRSTTANIVRLPQTDPAVVKGYISGLSAAGNTSITLGMKWGVALIEPGAQGLYSEMIAAGQMPSGLAGRPFEWADKDSMKVIVVMTDGDHVEHTRIVDPYRTGTSPIYRSAGDGNYSIRHTANRPAIAGTNEYWVPHLGTWRSTPWNSGAGVNQLNWQDVWANQRVTWVAWQLYGRALGTTTTTRSTWYNDTLNAMRKTWSTEAAMDASMQTSCTQAKNNGVLIYGIAFEAPPIGASQIRACSSSDNYYFVANGSSINSAFNAIATNISQLRLTQ